MPLASFAYRGRHRWGRVDGDNLFPAPPGGPASLQAWLDLGMPPVDFGAGEVLTRADVTLMAPIPEPRRNIICLGLNYADHAAEARAVAPGGTDQPDHPIFFTKATTAVTGPDTDIVLDERVTRRLDWEVELAVVIGQGGRFISEDAALAHVLGYTVLNDLSARDLQKRHGQFFLGKSMDGSAPMGPWITTAEELGDPHALDIRCSVNGVTKQQSSTRNLIFGIQQIIQTLSRVMTLVPGDIIATGTPGGVGFARDPREFLWPGDEVICEVEGIGVLRNRIIAPVAKP